MTNFQRSTLSFLLALISALPVTVVVAMEVGDPSASVFKFQHKLADKGNVQAQFKLAMMYETGSGVAADIAQARQWYQQSATAGNQAAADRLTYLAIKQKGYQKTQHRAWLAAIQAAAQQRKVEPMYLLGELYSQGLGVKKDLDKALALFSYVESTGDINVESDIASIHNQQAAAKVARKKAARKTAAKRKSHQAVAVTRADNVTLSKADAGSGLQQKETITDELDQQSSQQTLASQQAKKEQQVETEKRRRYEEAMAQIRLEQQQIDALQSQVSGDESATVDDEI